MTRGLCAMALTLLLAATQSQAVFAEEPGHRAVRLGFVGPLSPGTWNFTRFWERLHELGWVEGKNLHVERRSAEGHLDRLPALIADVIDRKVDVLVTYGTPGAIAARKATTTVPIVAWALSDPIGHGLAASLARPGGNLSGLSTTAAEGVAGKFLELLHDAVPRLATVAVIFNPNNRMTRDLKEDIEDLAPARNLKIHIIELDRPEALARAFQRARQKAQAVVVMGEPITLEHRSEVITLAAKHRLPAFYLDFTYVEAGGLMSYGPDFPAMFERAAEFADKILKGAKPADLPIEQPTRYVLSVNLKAARTLGITIPQSILLRADQVIR